MDSTLSTTDAQPTLALPSILGVNEAGESPNQRGPTGSFNNLRSKDDARFYVRACFVPLTADNDRAARHCCGNFPDRQVEFTMEPGQSVSLDVEKNFSPSCNEHAL